jgi:hypothetical protein
MDKETSTQIDETLEQELIFNERTVEHPERGRIKLIRPTPKLDRLIADERRKQKNKDLLDPDVLTRDQLKKIATQRGIWSEADETRVQDLSIRMGEIMAVLELTQYNSFPELLAQFRAVRVQILDKLEPDSEGYTAAFRFLDLEREPSTRDRILIQKAGGSTELDELLEEASVVRKQMSLLEEMMEVRQELNKIHVRARDLFEDSLEARAERAEEMARLFYCTRTAETDSPLWSSLDAAWESKPDFIQWLSTEMYYFRNGITDELKDIFGRHGFTQRATTTESSSDDSQGLPPSSSVGESQEKKQEPSSEATE